MTCSLPEHRPTLAQALQIEIARSLYMDETRIERAPGLAPLARNLTALIDVLGTTDWAFLRP